MTKRIFAIGAPCGTALFFTLLFQAQAPVAAVEQQVPSGVLTVELESDKPAYRVGETVKVRISIKNSTAENYSLSAVPPWALCSLTILDGSHRPLPSSGLRFGWRITAPGKTYPSHSTQAIGFNDPYGNSEQFVYWAPVSIWGYSLDKPGAYTITASANFTATDVGLQPYQQFAVTEKSNSVGIKIVP